MSQASSARTNHVVIDTNVWISAALSRNGPPALVVQRVLARGVPVFSSAAFAELESRLWKPKFDRYLSMELRRRILHDANAAAHWVTIATDTAPQPYSRDPDDDKFIHTALAANSLCLVSGDQDLLTVRADLSVRIVTPTHALQLADFCP